jgi:hypothetical protein
VELEKSLAVATRAPIEAATIIAEAQESVRQKLADLQTATQAADPKAAREFFKTVLSELTFEPRKYERPARFTVRAAVRLEGANRIVTPPCRHAR